MHRRLVSCQSLLTGYVRRFNTVHRHRGHLFQGRYKSIVCDRESYLLELVRYIHLNPVRAGLVKQPGDWAWSGHGEYLGKDNWWLIDPGPVMGEFGTAARYEAFIGEASRKHTGRNGILGIMRRFWDRKSF